MADERLYTWQIEATTPGVWKHPTTGEERPTTKNLNLQVVAQSLAKAVTAVEKQYAPVTFIKVMRDRHIDALIVADDE